MCACWVCGPRTGISLPASTGLKAHPGLYITDNGIVAQWGLWLDSLGSNHSSALGRPRSPKSQDPFFQFVLLLLGEIMWIPFPLSSMTPLPHPSLLTLEHSFPGNLQPLGALTRCKGPEAQRKNEGEGWTQPCPAGQLKVFRFLKPVSG